MALDPLHAFYCTDAWNALARNCKVESGGVFDISELRAHHKRELTIDNVGDVNISLNPENVEVLCTDCHNAVHARFGYAVGEKHVYVVHGSPYAGKTTYVETVATRNDIVVDLDRIHAAICVSGRRDRPDATKAVAFRLRDLMLDEIRTATRQRRWQDAYIIGGYPDRIDRDAFVRDYGAELVHIATPKAECIRRAVADCEGKAQREAVLGYIEKYWQRFRE